MTPKIHTKTSMSGLDSSDSSVKTSKTHVDLVREMSFVRFPVSTHRPSSHRSVSVCLSRILE